MNWITNLLECNMGKRVNKQAILTRRIFNWMQESRGKIYMHVLSTNEDIGNSVN